VVAVDQGEHFVGDFHTWGEIDLQPDATGLDDDESRLQILVEPMSKTTGRKGPAMRSAAATAANAGAR
jgi:hypothetical protein